MRFYLFIIICIFFSALTIQSQRAIADEQGFEIDPNVKKKYRPAKSFPKVKEEDCLEICLQEKGAEHFKTVQSWEANCIKANKSLEDKGLWCKQKSKEQRRILDLESIKVCQERCG